MPRQFHTFAAIALSLLTTLFASKTRADWPAQALPDLFVTAQTLS